MHANFIGDQASREDLQAKLTEAAFRVASGYGVKGLPIDQRLDLWKALGRVVHEQNRASGGRAAERMQRETLVAEATDAAYRVALDHGFRGAFIDLELDLWKHLCQALAQALWVSEPSGHFGRSRI